MTAAAQLPATAMALHQGRRAPRIGKIMAPKPLNIAQKALILHTSGVQAGLRDQGLESGPRVAELRVGFRVWGLGFRV